jgi:mono/diheme cytochrome c family protein
LKRTVRAGLLAGLLLLAFAAGGPVVISAQTGADAEFFAQKVRPVLAESCIGCHAETAMGGLRLDSREALLKGGKNGPAVVVGDPEKSLLIASVRHSGALKMPMGGARLSDAKIADLAAWVKTGAVWPDARLGTKPESALSEHFESRIRPVLAQQCFACHTNTRSGGLRLDSARDLLAGGKSGPAVVPGDPEHSLLMAALRHTGPVRMPKGATRLTDDVLADFSAWIKDGAYWPAEKTVAKQYTDAEKKIWSIQPLRSPAVPAVRDTAWPLTNIDRFVLARLEREGLKPSRTADRRTLLRRVTYDVTGVMPTLEQVQAFERDTSPKAWETVVDRLLASPQYGERWARHWMDVVRYGEDDYNVGAKPDRAERYPFAYLYRDWLIRALNDDIPYDLFVKAQLAADLLDGKLRDRHLPALGMNGNGIWIFHANPAPVERADEWHDKVDVTTKAFLGLTVGCARCHDHKYDAIYARDYYSMASIFASSRFKAYPQVPTSVVADYEKQAKVLKKKKTELEAFVENAASLYADALLAQAEDYMLAARKVATQKKATVATMAEEAKLDPEILERWARFLKKKEDYYPDLGPWQAMMARGGGTDEEARKLAGEFRLKVLDISERKRRLEKENEFVLAQVKGTSAGYGEDDDKPKEPFDPLPNGKKRFLNRNQIDLKGLSREDQLLWRDVFRDELPDGGLDTEILGDKLPPGLLRLSGGALDRRLTADLRAHVDRAKADIEAFEKGMPPRYPAVFGIEEADAPSDLKVFVRGNPYTFGEDAPRGFPSIFTEGRPKAFSKGSGRLELAEEILRQPLTARVIVNRLWTWHMGRGIVDTPSNFGIVGERPTNPELLDYLATTFIADGMSWKKLHKDILMSRTYQLAATPDAGSTAKDPENRLYSRANRRRLDAEGVWDTLLQASGALDTAGLGGPSQNLDEKMNRRGVYASVSRMYPGDLQAMFDLPTATISAEKRYTTNVPQQRLFFLNSPVVRRQAETLAEQLRAAGDEPAQVRRAFQTIYQREPTDDELAGALEFIRLPPAAAAGSPFRSFIWALLSSNEFLYID